MSSEEIFYETAQERADRIKEESKKIVKEARKKAKISARKILEKEKSREREEKLKNLQNLLVKGSEIETKKSRT